MMSDEVLEAVLKALDHPKVTTLDITGGAPELHPKFRELVHKARAMEKKVLVRHNLTVTLDPHPLTGESLLDLPDFFDREGVELVSSLPFYETYFTDKQRGDGVFQKSIKSLQLLNERGFGRSGSQKYLNLVYNPAGAFLPGDQKSLEQDFKRVLYSQFGIEFHALYALTNMPIHRFKFQLKKKGNYEEYMEKLVSAFNPKAALSVMCRDLISVDYRGELYDCDFHQVLDLPLAGLKSPRTIFSFSYDDLLTRSIVFKDHCYGCTAGSGSSCGGATAEG